MADVITFQARACLSIREDSFDMTDTFEKSVVFSEAVQVDDKNDLEDVAFHMMNRTFGLIKSNHPHYKFSGWLVEPFIIGSVSV